MVTALIAVVVCLAVGLGICAIELWTLPRRRRRCLVSLLRDEGAIDGILWNRRGPWIVLRDARLMRPNGEAVPTDGEVMIDRAQIAFIQVL